MLAPDSAIARKHIEICLKVKNIAVSILPDCDVYVATYTAGQSGQSYQRIEEECRQEFWSIKAWTLTPPPIRLKDPDVIITRDKCVKFLIEVKWGSVPGRASTDLRMNGDEWRKMEKLLRDPAMCRVRGPAVRSGQRYRSQGFQSDYTYETDSQTKLVLVSNFSSMKRELSAQFNEFLSSWKHQNIGLLIADINARVGEIPSFRELIEAHA